MTHPLAGVFAAAVTPLKLDFSPDLDAIPGLLDFLARRGCHGVLLLGTTGEGPSFSTEERAEIYRSALQVRGTQPALQLLVGTGTPSLSETVSLTRTAFDLGFDGVVVLPPYYFRKATDDGLFSYFSELIRRAVPGDGTVLGYHFPGTAGIGFSPDLLSRLKQAFPRQFAGIKDSSHDPALARLLGERFGDQLLVMTGTDSLFQLALENQAGGCVTAAANLISPELRGIWDGFQNGGDVAARQAHVTDLRHFLEQYSPFPPTLKSLLSSVHGFPAWPVRPPLENLRSDISERLTQDWKDIAR